jgi:hypothetical protein
MIPFQTLELVDTHNEVLDAPLPESGMQPILGNLSLTSTDGNAFKQLRVNGHQCTNLPIFRQKRVVAGSVLDVQRHEHCMNQPAVQNLLGGLLGHTEPLLCIHKRPTAIEANIDDMCIVHA